MQCALGIKEDEDGGRAVGRPAHAGIGVETAGDDDAQHRARFRVVILVDDQLHGAGHRRNVRLGHVHKLCGLRETSEMILQRDRETPPYGGRLKDAITSQYAQIEGVDDAVRRIGEPHQILIGRDGHACEQRLAVADAQNDRTHGNLSSCARNHRVNHTARIVRMARIPIT